MKRLRWLLAPMVASLLVLGVACGGDDDGDDGGASTGASNDTPAATSTTTTATGSAAPTGATGSTGAPASTGASTDQGSLNVDNVAASLEDVESFRFNMTMSMDFDMPEGQSSEDAAGAAMLAALLGNIEVEGEYVAPDRVRTSMTFFGMDMQAIQIGDESWTNDGSGWTADASGDASMDMMPFDVSDPSEFFEFIPADQLEGAETSRETVNGFETTKYHFDKDSLTALAESSGESMGMEDFGEVDTMDLDLWLTDEGLPVKMLMNIDGESEGSQIAIQMEFNISDLNDPGISIERPI